MVLAPDPRIRAITRAMPILGDVVPGRKLHVSLFAAFFVLAISQSRGASFSSSSSTSSSLPLSLSSLLAGASGSSSSSSSLQSSKKIPIIRLDTYRYPHFKEGPSNHHLHHEQIKSNPFLLLQKRDPQANGMSLSITNNMDVLRSKFLRELIQRRENKFRQNWVRNQELLDDIGKKRK